LSPSVMAAVDLGASGGRVIAGRVSASGVELHEVSRFPNEPVRVGGTLHWDILGLYRSVCSGLSAAASTFPLASAGIDAWPGYRPRGPDERPGDRLGFLICHASPSDSLASVTSSVCGRDVFTCGRNVRDGVCLLSLIRIANPICLASLLARGSRLIPRRRPGRHRVGSVGMKSGNFRI